MPGQRAKVKITKYESSGTASQIISGLKIASLNSGVFCSPGMGPNVAVLHVDD
jgi:hypothetical protein